MTFSYFLNKFSKELTTIEENGWEYKKNKLHEPPNCTSEQKASKIEVLSYFHTTLKKTPFLYIDQETYNTFTSKVKQYTTTVNKKEADKVKVKANTLFKFLDEKGSKIPACFINPIGKELNEIIDKNLNLWENKDYLILYYLANYLAFKRLLIHFFSNKFAIILKIEELKKACKHSTFKPTKDKYEYLFSYPPSEMSDSLPFSLFVKFHDSVRPQVCHKDFTFLKEIVRRRIESNDPNFQNFLREYENIQCIGFLLSDFFSENKRKEYELLTQMKNEIDQSFIDNLDLVNKYFHPFSTTTDSFDKFLESGIQLSPMNEQGKDFKTLSDALLNWFVPEVKHFNEWYKTMYDKIVEYQKKHSEVQLPFINPKKFESDGFFTTPENLKISLLKDIQEWEIEIQKEIKKRPIPTLDVQKENFSEIISKGTTHELDTEKKLLKALKATSIFQVHERITAWFIPNSKSKILNEESPLIHSFAWAINNILWKFGLRYPHVNKLGENEPALAMLCQVEHYLFPKPELFRLTATFSCKIDSSTTSKSFTYDPNWICYHRTLTRRNQNNEDVEEYIENGKNQFIDFPLLPSQCLNIEHSEELNKVYPDGSYIESVKGATITIRDPKNDGQKVSCRFRLFVLR